MPSLGDMTIHQWNDRIYRDKDGKNVPGDWQSEELWNLFQIKSGPKFKDWPWSAVPAKWTGDVGDLISAIKDRFGDKVEFLQIKEKWAHLTIYFGGETQEMEREVEAMIVKCQEKLRSKGLHP